MSSDRRCHPTGIIQEHLSEIQKGGTHSWNTMLKLTYALHKLRVKHATHYSTDNKKKQE